MPPPLYLTAELPGIGGRLRATPEDFIVEEIPLYLPCGEGQHVYVEIEKRGLTTYAAIRAMARALGITPKDVGHAGLKDAHAVTRQTLSFNLVTPEAVQALAIPNIKILKVQRHRNKLKVGHLAGNRFVIRVQDVAQSALAAAEAIVVRLAQQGIPNFFGEQRFGVRGNTGRLGHMLICQNGAEFLAELLGRPQAHEASHVQTARRLVDEGRLQEALALWPANLAEERRVLAAVVKANGQPEIALKIIDRKLKSLFVSAFQSELFNQLLAARLDTLDQLEAGDVAYIHGKGASFVVEDVQREQPRADAFEISPAGPMFGPKMLAAGGQPGVREAAVLARQQLRPDSFAVPGQKIRGTRRPYRIQLKSPQIWWEQGIMVSFELEPGAYATTVMAEIMKGGT